MNDRLNIEQIREFWTRQAIEHGQAPSASWSDQMVIEMEIGEIVKRLSDGDRVLDIGCANGYSTIQFAAHRAIDILGLDYIPEMVEQAQRRLASITGSLIGDVAFDVGDIGSLGVPSDEYDKVVVIRVIINLSNWDNQLRGLRECVRVLKPGGVLLLSEATLQGWQNMNRFRKEWDLSEIPMPPFNQYVDENQIIDSLSETAKLVEVVNFSSTYFVGTRVLKPLLVQALGSNIDIADPNTEWNRWFSQLPAWGDYGTQKLFVFKKR